MTVINNLPLPITTDKNEATLVAGLSISNDNSDYYDITVQLTVLHGTLNVVLTGVSIEISAGANDSPNITLHCIDSFDMYAALQQINDTLATLGYTPNNNYVGGDTLTIHSSVDGDVSFPLTDTDNLSITIQNTVLTTQDKPMKPPYNSTEISQINVNLIQDAELDAFHSGVIISDGGTNYATGTIVSGVNLSTKDNLLVDSTAINSITQIYEPPISATLITKAITDLAIITESAGATATNWDNGLVSVDLGGSSVFPVSITATVLLTDFVPSQYNGIKTAVFSGNAGQFTFISDDFGAVTTEGSVSILEGTIAVYDLPVDLPISAYISGVQPKSLLSGESLLTFTSSNFYTAPLKTYGGTITVDSAKIKIAKLGVTSTFPSVSTMAYIKGIGDSSYNGTNQILYDAGFIYYAPSPDKATTPIAKNPSFASAKVSQALVTATAHNKQVGAKIKLTLVNNSPDSYNATWSSVVVDANTFTIVPTRLIGDAIDTGSVLTPAAANLSYAIDSFFSQGQSFENGQAASVSIIELGTGSITDSIDLLSSQIANYPDMFHAYCLPPNWTTNDMATLAQSYNDLKMLPTFFIQCADYNKSIKFNDLNRVICAVDGNNRAQNEFESAILMFKFLAKDATEQNPLTQTLYAPVIGTPYDFENKNDPLIALFAENNINYFAKASEGGRTNALIMGGCTKASDSYGTAIDMMSLWSNDYFNFYADQLLAARVMDGASNPSKRLSLNDTDGQYSINDLRATLQGFIDDCKKAKMIEDSVVIDGKTYKTEALAQEYFAWKRANAADWNAKRYSGLSVNISYRLGIANITTNLNVKF